MTRQGRDSSGPTLLSLCQGSAVKAEAGLSADTATVLPSRREAQVRTSLCLGTSKGWAVGQTRCLGACLAAQTQQARHHHYLCVCMS